MSNPHAFVELFANPTDLEDWIADLCGRKIARPQIGPAFPALTATQSADDWLVEQFYALSDMPGARDRLRQAIVTLIATHGGRDASPNLRDQIVGTLLHVAGSLNFIEIARHLVDWSRRPCRAEALASDSTAMAILFSSTRARQSSTRVRVLCCATTIQLGSIYHLIFFFLAPIRSI
jgi:hypothetical protein